MPHRLGGSVHELLRQCPVCEGDLIVTRIGCPACETVIEGQFEPGPFAELSREQLDFVLAFVRCEGKFTRLQVELGLSYPTLRSRLHDVIRALGYEPGTEESSGPTEKERRDVQTALEEGRLTAEEAVRYLRLDELGMEKGLQGVANHGRDTGRGHGPARGRR